MTAVAVAALSFALFGTGSLHLLHTLRQNQGRGDWHSIPGFISTRLGFGTIGHVTGIVLGGAFAAVVVWLVRRVWRGRLDWIDGAAWATVAMLATASSLLPWYIAWLMPLAALGRDPRLRARRRPADRRRHRHQLLGYTSPRRLGVLMDAADLPEPFDG